MSTPKQEIDHSLGINEGELKHFSKDAAVKYLLMPECMKKLEDQVQALHVDLEELNGTLNKLFALAGSQELEPEQRRLQDYVS